MYKKLNKIFIPKASKYSRYNNCKMSRNPNIKIDKQNIQPIFIRKVILMP